jgi:hypothetical protein
MRRRELIAAAAGLGVATVLPGTAAASPTIGQWDTVMLRKPSGEHAMTSSQIHAALATVVQHLTDARYREAAAMVPAVVTAADEHASNGGRGAAALLTRAYVLATAVSVKERGDVGMITADRAAQAARLAQDPLAAASAARAQTIVLRQRGHHAQARVIADTAIADLAAEKTARPVVANICLESAYGAAQAGQSSDALALWEHASELAERCPTVTIWPDHAGPLTSDQIQRYALCIHHLLGNTRAALSYSSKINVHAMPTAERRARYRHDSAKLHRDLGDLPRALKLLREHEHETPQDARRTSLRRVVSDMLTTSPAPPGLRQHAALVGAA